MTTSEPSTEALDAVAEMPTEPGRRAAELRIALRHYTGSERFFRYHLNRAVLYTEGAQFLFEQAGAYWLLDKIALSCRYEAAVRVEGFQAWTLTVRPDTTATLVCTDGNNRKVFTEDLTYTDFPMPEITLWAIENEFGKGHYTIMLPSEY